MLSGRPAAGTLGLAPIDSRINGVRLGAITYSFRAIADANAIVKAMASIRLGEAELMANHAEALAGAPAGRAEIDAWRRSTSPETWKRVRGIFDELGTVVVRPPVDTLLVEPDLARFELVARVAFPIGRGRKVLREIRVDTETGA